MQKSIIALLLVLTPSASFAQSSTESITIGRCNGMNFEVEERSLTASAIATLYDRLPARPEGANLMRFENDEYGSTPYYHWNTDHSGYIENTYCEDVYYRQNKPLSGTWSFEPLDTTLVGCPDALDPTRGMTSVQEFTWETAFHPEDMLTQFPFEFDYERINGHQWNATVDAMPNLPEGAEVLIKYEFQVDSRTSITVHAFVDMKISIGSTAIDCKGSVYMLGTYQE